MDEERSSVYYDNLLNEMDKTLDNIANNKDPKYSQDFALDDPISIKLSSLAFERIRDNKPISLNKDIIPILSDILVDKASSNSRLYEVRAEVMNIFKKLTKEYNLVCIPRLDLDKDDENSVNITDLLYFDMEEI